MSLLIVDYGMGNLGSVRRAFEECGAESVLISDKPKDLKKASRFVLPGVGAFRDGIGHLNRTGWLEAISQAIEAEVPMLGICLGMQLLAEHGDEGGETVAGLGLLPGHVQRLVPEEPSSRIPHVGWNEVYEKGSSRLLKGIMPGTDFYFVHSYHFVPSAPNVAVAQTPYCGDFVSAVEKDNVFGVQFHPEKSSKPGFQVFKNFLKI